MLGLGRRKFVIAVGIFAFLAFCWVGFRHYRCLKRRKALHQQIAHLERDAKQQLRPGTTKSVLAQFFAEREMHLNIYNSEASGDLDTSGCSPVGCGTDAFIIIVRVKLDEAGVVKEAPRVSGLYTNCL